MPRKDISQSLYIFFDLQREVVQAYGQKGYILAIVQ